MFNFNFFLQKSPQQRFLFILGLFMFIFYLAIGIVFIFFKALIPFQIETVYRIIFGIGLILYSFFRFYGLVSNKHTD
jgi:uncharacterized membrane protein (DUF485 family)